MKILVTGYTGQLGYDIVRVGKSAGFEMVGVGSADLDITNASKVESFIIKTNPDAIVHCAAFTAVDLAEDEKEKCYKVNVEGTNNVVLAAKACKAKLVYISTDYVFDGAGAEEFEESHSVDPICYYGLTKEQGEKLVRDNIGEHFIVRISWVFGINGNNFVKTMLNLAKTRNEVNVVGDQYGSPTYTLDVAKLIVGMIETNHYGTYHATNEGVCSWAEFAEEIFNQSTKSVLVNSIPSSEYPTKAKRPLNSRLSKSKLESMGFNRLPHWKDALSRYLVELEEKENSYEQK